MFSTSSYYHFDIDMLIIEFVPLIAKCWLSPGRRISCRWLQQRDPQCDVAKKIQKMVRKHADEVAFMLEVTRLFLFLHLFVSACF